MAVAFVSGGSKGIGLATVLRLLAEGHRVITCSRDADAWKQAIEQHPQLTSADYMRMDISNEAVLKEAFGHIKEKYSQLDIAVNNASPDIASAGRFAQISDDDLRSTMTNDFWAYALCMKYQLNMMSEGARIVNISSINGLRPTPSAAMYGASKHALEGLTRSVALDAIKNGIRVNSVAPGVTWTSRWERKQQEEPEIREEVSKLVPVQRFAHPDEVVDAIMYLLSDSAQYIIGHTLVIDGGISLT
ncbi:SDR family oxidoreductase [Vibrio sp. S4M6]|uniref:SDR family NAD(P)-dependent oxidoreductase n=1 Tax=Vibrio sinus TaxID=2946865 RepID=UPI002029FF6D|nr:SDR family oxidoreductase [Vibrio sinus]MCL9780004.1 SDR family oxidoreductase [Vibrio sinus]